MPTPAARLDLPAPRHADAPQRQATASSAGAKADPGLQAHAGSHAAHGEAQRQNGDPAPSSCGDHRSRSTCRDARPLSSQPVRQLTQRLARQRQRTAAFHKQQQLARWQVRLRQHAVDERPRKELDQNEAQCHRASVAPSSTESASFQSSKPHVSAGRAAKNRSTRSVAPTI